MQQKREDLQELCLSLDFNQTELLDDTVTELVIQRKHDDTPPVYQNDIALPDCTLPLTSTPRFESEYQPVISELRFRARQDPFRVRYPLFSSSADTRTIEFFWSERSDNWLLGSGGLVYPENHDDGDEEQLDM